MDNGNENLSDFLEPASNFPPSPVSKLSTDEDDHGEVRVLDATVRKCIGSRSEGLFDGLESDGLNKGAEVDEVVVGVAGMVIDNGSRLEAVEPKEVSDAEDVEGVIGEKDEDEKTISLSGSSQMDSRIDRLSNQYTLSECSETESENSLLQVLADFDYVDLSVGEKELYQHRNISVFKERKLVPELSALVTLININPLRALSYFTKQGYLKKKNWSNDLITLLSHQTQNGIISRRHLSVFFANDIKVGHFIFKKWMRRIPLKGLKLLDALRRVTSHLWPPEGIMSNYLYMYSEEFVSWYTENNGGYADGMKTMVQHMLSLNIMIHVRGSDKAKRKTKLKDQQLKEFVSDVEKAASPGNTSRFDIEAWYVNILINKLQPRGDSSAALIELDEIYDMGKNKADCLTMKLYEPSRRLVNVFYDVFYEDKRVTRRVVLIILNDVLLIGKIKAQRGGCLSRSYEPTQSMNGVPRNVCIISSMFISSNFTIVRDQAQCKFTIMRRSDAEHCTEYNLWTDSYIQSERIADILDDQINENLIVADLLSKGV